ncbi:hypothetical protein IJ768_03895 [Candidatus Saccharibacteria bacterium]|nr:hypothetical protein [Candidatus Saccharibacteria bacterium]
MPKLPSKSKKSAKKTQKPAKKPEKLGFWANLKLKIAKQKDKRSFRNQTKVKLHKSFKRSYREDYLRETPLPGLLSHANATFKVIFSNWKLFLSLILLVLIFNIILVGLMSEDSYNTFKDALEETNENLAQGQLGSIGKAGLLLIGTVTTGGLSRGMTEVQQVFMVLLGVIIWLTTIYLTRHILAGHKIKLRDGLYNALTPLVSTICVVGVIFLELIPIFAVIITYSAAIATEFLATPFYALVYFIFASLMILLSAYLLSSSLLALIAVTAPGLYPMTALNTASDIIAGRRIRFIIRLLFVFFILALCWIVVMLPIILLDTALKANIEWLNGIPIVSFFLLFMTLFSVVYMSIYFYLFYRKLLDMD